MHRNPISLSWSAEQQKVAQTKSKHTDTDVVRAAPVLRNYVSPGLPGMDYDDVTYSDTITRPIMVGGKSIVVAPLSSAGMCQPEVPAL